MRNKLTLTLLGIFFAFIVAEIGLRIFSSHIPVTKLISPYDFPCYQKGSYLYQQLLPNKTCILKSNFGAFPDSVVKTNSLGLRNNEIAEKKPQNMKRIVFLGDSFTMGLGVGETQAFPRLVEQSLNTKENTMIIQTINAGINGVGPLYEYVYLKKAAIKFQPDVVVVGFVPWKDVPWDVHDLEFVSRTDADGLPDAVGSKKVYVDSRGYLRDTSLPLRFTVPFVRSSSLIQLALRVIVPIRDMYIGGFTDSFCIFQLTCHTLDNAKEITKKTFLDMKAILDQHNAQLLVVLIPAEFQIYSNTAPGKYFANTSIGLNPVEKRRPHVEFNKFFEEKGISYVDLLPVFYEHLQDKSFFDLDTHWNSSGHEIAASSISQKLSTMLQ